MSDNSNKGMPESCVQADIYDNNEAIPQSLTPSPGSLQVPPDLVTADPNPPSLKYPVSSCSLVLTGGISQRYLRTHLKNPKICGRRGEERVAWINLHKTEHDRLIETGVTPTKPKLGAKKQEEEKISRTVAFRLRAGRLGITDAALVAEKLAIWEGMWVDKEKARCEGLADREADELKHDAWVLLDTITDP
ncbi:hypothetical protein HOY80DRAFT_999745 [Tuber brumale]|nr:hypothetical protein HOY80DRAFT_999745 [Tuber brumale]